MRKNLIAMSVATLVAGLGLAGGASAAVFADNGVATTTPTNATAETVQNGGIGHQLIIPYYNVQGGNATLFNIVNTDLVNGKAVKIRFRGASNSDDVFDFQLYLSPGDMWATTLTKAADGTATLATVDKSCTIPNTINGTPFVTARLPSFLTAAQKAQQTREGYIEIFNMADIPPTTPNADGSSSATANPLYTAIKHVNGTPPGCSSAAINALATDPATLAAAYADGFRSPSTGLFANFTIINVPKSGAETGEAVSIAATVGVNGANGRGNIVFFPQVAGGATTPDSFTADPALRTVAGGATGVQNGSGGAYAGGTVPIIAASQFDLPDLSTPYLLLAAYPPVAADPINQAEALTRSLAVMNVINEFITDPVIAANTDWVFSLPTRRYSVALDYRPATAAGVTNAQRAFTKFINRDYFDSTNSPVALSSTTGMPQICVTTQSTVFYDREEGTFVGSSFVISPNPPAPQFALCGETNVLTFNSPFGASVLGAEISSANTTVPNNVTVGWAQVNTPGLTTGAAPNVGGNGLPILGKAYVTARNNAVQAGFTTNFGGSWEHRYQRPLVP
ncbi:cell surface protein [Caenimonas terrae]|uniref:Cell surface protein n=1 Tax=Caenimonas terrae TaxID=696074 RepID=A0ABW0NNP2_9BURK